MKTRACTIAVLALLAAAPTTWAQGTTRVLNVNDLKNLHVFMEAASAESGRLPDKAAIMAALKMDKGTAALVKAIEDGHIVLTGNTERESVWAYEAAALTKGGYILTNQGLEKLSAADVKKRLGK